MLFAKGLYVTWICINVYNLCVTRWESNGSQAQEASTSQEDNESSEEASENPNMAAESDSANSEPSFPNHAGLTLPGHGLSNILYFIHYIDNNGYEIFQIEDPEDTENTYSNDNLMMDLGDITNNGNISNEQQALAVTMQCVPVDLYN